MHYVRAIKPKAYIAKKANKFTVQIVRYPHSGNIVWDSFTKTFVKPWSSEAKMQIFANETVYTNNINYSTDND